MPPSNDSLPHSIIDGGSSVPSTHVGAAMAMERGFLLFLDGALVGRDVEVEGECVIGRAAECSIVLPPREPSVSARHCMVRRSAAGWWVVSDLGSKGGTFVNSERIKAGAAPVLQSGDILRFGSAGPLATFKLRSSTYAAPAPQYGITLSRVGVDDASPQAFTNRAIVSLGRDPQCDIRFDKDARVVSKRHARIRHTGEGFVVEDLETKAGTLLNGERISSSPLRVGDIIELGAEGPKLVVDAIEGAAEKATEAVAHAAAAARKSGRTALLGTTVAVLAAVAVWWFGARRSDELADQVERTEHGVGEAVAAALPISDTERFKAVERRHRPAVLFIYAAFRINAPGYTDEAPFYEGDSFGTGFVLSPDGYAVTNRHVVQPWVGDTEYAAAYADAQTTFGADKVSITSRLAAWPAESEALNGDRTLAFDRGFNTHQLANLTVAGFPPEHLVDVEFEGKTVKIVAPDHTDLALLKLEGLVLAAGAIPPLAPPDRTLEPLDRVMSLGFPHGERMLEGTTANLSPTLGEIRKIEDTIQLSIATYPGNSGGPVLSADGEVLGVTTRRMGEGLGVCIPVAMVRELVRRVGI